MSCVLLLFFSCVPDLGSAGLLKLPPFFCMWCLSSMLVAWQVQYFCNDCRGQGSLVLASAVFWRLR